jgi:hypothetical protein
VTVGTLPRSAKVAAVELYPDRKTGGPGEVEGSPGGYFGMAPDDEDDVQYVPD